MRPARTRTVAGLFVVAILTMAVLTTVALASAGCGARRQPTAEPVPRPSQRPGLIERAAVGDRLTVTAVTDQVLGPRSFTVRDADLPADGLLVLAGSPAALRPRVLVTVVGTVATFRYADVGAPYDLVDPSRYRLYEGRKVLMAESVRSYG